MLIMKIPTVNNSVISEVKIVPFEECIKQLKYYFVDIKKVRSRLHKGEIIKTPYFKFKCMMQFQFKTTPEFSITEEE